LARVSATFQIFCEFVDFCWKLFGRIYGFRICFGNFLEAVRIAELWRNWRPPVGQSFGSILEVCVKLRWKFLGSFLEAFLVFESFFEVFLMFFGRALVTKLWKNHGHMLARVSAPFRKIFGQPCEPD